MMKQFSFLISSSQESLFFTPIRNKVDMIKILLEAIKYIRFAHKLGDVVKPIGRVVLMTNKMNRMTFYSTDKYFSISLPFDVQKIEGECRFFSKSLGEIDSIVISRLQGILKKESILESSCISELATAVLDETALNSGFWGILKEVLLMESGYLRFDHDKGNENGKIHPLNHLDICYTTKATYKIGINDKVSESDFLDIIDTTTDSFYLSK